MQYVQYLVKENLKYFHSIQYETKVLNEAHVKYATTKKELLALVYGLEKYSSYLIGLKIVIYIEHATIKYLMNGPDSKPCLIRLTLLLKKGIRTYDN